jgi:hypothetical protein
MIGVLTIFIQNITAPLENTVCQVSAMPNGSEKHGALLALGLIQTGRLALIAIINGAGSVGVTSTPTARS